MARSPLLVVSGDRTFATLAHAGDQRLDELDIRDHELLRARGALAYLKSRIGDAAMRTLLADDIATMTAMVREWVAASEGRWQSAVVTALLPGPGAEAFRDWYSATVADHRADRLRAGHPEHYLNTPGDRGVEVIEPIGETDLPWRIFYRSLAPDADLPSAWDPNFPVRFAAEVVDEDGLRVGYSMRALRDVGDRTEIQLTTHLPAAAPPELLARHLRHFLIEYRNWAFLATAEQRGSS